MSERGEEVNYQGVSYSFMCILRGIAFCILYDEAWKEKSDWFLKDSAKVQQIFPFPSGNILGNLIRI